MSASPLRILIVGFGSIGQRHLRNLQKDKTCVVAVCRRTTSDAQQTRQAFDVEAFDSLRTSENWHPDGILICNPTSHHLETAHWAIEQGCHVLIEKPIACDTAGVADLLKRAEDQCVQIGIACNMRFHPALIAIKQAIDQGAIGRLLSIRAEVGSFLPDWHPDKDYRTEYSARADQGGGALLTLIHELDYVYWIAGDIVKTTGWRTHASSLELNVDDLAELICRHQNGAISAIHMDFLDRAYHRHSRWIGETGTLDWTWKGPVRLLLPGGHEKTLWSDPAFDFNQTYIEEIDDFLNSIRHSTPPRTTGREGLRVLEIAQSIKEI